MAFVSNNQDEEEPTNQSQGPIAPGGTGQTVHLAPSSGIGSAGGSPTPGAASSQGAGGQFATLNQYVDANQGQAQPLANKITNDIGSQYNTLQGQNQSVLQGIQGQVSQGYTPQDQGVLSQEAADPVSFASNPSNISSFQKQLTDQYTGPTSAESTNDFSNQQAAINNAIATGTAQTGTDTGRQQLLAQNEAMPTAGVTGLNSAILAQDPNAQGQIENAYKPFSNLATSLNTGASGIDTSIGQAQNQASQASTAANQQIANQVNALNSGVNTELTNATTARDAYNTAVQNNQNVWNPVNTQLNSLDEVLANITKGFTPVAGGSNTVVNPLGQYVNAPISANAPTLAAVATPQDYANAQAFQSLLNGVTTGAPSPILDASTANQAGTYQAPTAPTITDPKAEALNLYRAMAATEGVNQGPGSGPNGSELNVSNPWFTNTGNLSQYQQNMQQTQPIYNNLQTLLSKIYGSQLGIGS